MDINGGHITTSTTDGVSHFVWNVCRGNSVGADSKPHYNRNIAIAYDKVIILEEGEYRVSVKLYNQVVDARFYMLLNGINTNKNMMYVRIDPSDTTIHAIKTRTLKRGDMIICKGYGGGTSAFYGVNTNHQQYTIEKIGD